MPHFRQGTKNIAEICARHGISKVIIAPGSRNAPLIFAFTAQTDLDCLSITDERSAAYFALGIAQQSDQAVALLCTSGTAVLNFAPAIAEAYYQNLPLVVFTADRPAELIDQANGQTLKQSNIFANYIKASFDLALETVSDVDLEYSDRQVSQAIDTALSFPRGPVQINVPLREPIYTALPENHSHPKIIKTMASHTFPTRGSMDLLKQTWTSYPRKMIVVGIFPKNEALNELVNRLAMEPDIVVIAENLSNTSGPALITQPESLFASINALENKELFKPDLLITIGQSVICKQLKAFLYAQQPLEQWQFEATLPYVDTYKSLNTIVPGLAAKVLADMPLAKVQSTYSHHYQSQYAQVKERHSAFVAEAAISDMAAVALLLELAPKNITLQLANSTSVRWTQLFPSRKDITYLCNRGTSGIDGSLSTAAGYAFASQQATVFLTGDLSFVYDSNGLWNNYIGSNLKIIVLNNQGGNMFRFIGDSKLMEKSMDFFTTPHQARIKSLVQAYGLDYLACNETECLESSLLDLFDTGKATVLEIITNSDLNTEHYQGYFRAMKAPNEE